MNYIKSRKHASPAGLARAIPAATLAAGMALTVPMAAHADAAAETADLADMGDAGLAAQRKATKLDEIEVRGVRSMVTSPKFTQSLQDTPQTIEVIGKELFQQQGATTLTEALRNSAGVGTFYAGENGNTSTGDAVYMRGFDTSNSIYLDGARDLGSISRDLFNIEQVEVVKGPAGTDTGRSAPTGAINQVTKQANLRDAISASLTGGSDGQKRATADWNQTYGESSAFRLNAMWQDSDVAGRDRVNNSRWGLAPSLGWGLGTDTRIYADLLYVKQDNIPDGFVPTIGLFGWQPQPGLEQLAGHPVDPENFYGTADDHDNVTARMATLRLEHDFMSGVRLSNTLRWGKTEQDYFLTAFMSTGGSAANPMGGNIHWGDIADLSSYTMNRSNLTLKDQENRILTDQLNLQIDFATGAIEHFLSTGLEITREEQTTRNLAASGAVPPANLYHPDWNITGPAIAHTGAHSYGETTTSAVYAFDTLKFGEKFLITAGLRADRYDTDYLATAICTTVVPLPRGGVACPAGQADGSLIASTDLNAKDTLVNYKIGAVYKPTRTLSLYANSALSQQPPGGANFSLSSAANNANNPNLDPQKARTLELGTKWALFNEALALNLSLFQTRVSNEINSQQLDENGNPTQTGEKEVEGYEISAVGHISDAWTILLGYVDQDTRVKKGALVTADGTPNLTYTPDAAFTGWTTYVLPFGLSIGGGVRYTGGLHRGTDGALGTPKETKSYTVYDAMLSYPVNDAVTLRLNAYNLFDKNYVASINKSGYRYTPGTPRTFLLSADFHF